jgi:hypothetical protein
MTRAADGDICKAKRPRDIPKMNSKGETSMATPILLAGLARTVTPRIKRLYRGFLQALDGFAEARMRNAVRAQQRKIHRVANVLPVETKGDVS